MASGEERTVNGRTIERIHRILGSGMAPQAVDELAGNHVESDERRNGLTPRHHAEFLANNVVRRLVTPASSDMGAHFLPALVVTGVGIAIYLLGGEGASPDSAPTWPMIPLAVGVIWLIIQTSRANGFPVRTGTIPALVAGFGALADAAVMPIYFPEEQFIRAGLVILGLTGPSVFLLLAKMSPQVVSWETVRAVLARSRRLRLTWYLLSAGLALIAFGEVLAWSRFELPNSLQIGAVVTGIGLAWMAQSFYVAGRVPRAA